jgi:pyruvate dehydrogenase (quinone)
MQTITTIGLDIAKSVFQVHGVDAGGQVVIRRQLKRRSVLAFFQKLPRCLVGIEACASSHHWSRELQTLGHTVRLMPPAYVKPYVKRQKNDMADAEAICEAVTRANMRFVPTKTPEQQSCLMLHRTPAVAHGFTRSGVGYSRPKIIPEDADLAKAAEILNAGKKVAMLAGAGARGAAPLLIEMATLLGAGVAKALLGKDVLPDDLPFVTGAIGLLGTEPSWDLMQDCDTLLMVGTGFPWSEFLPKDGAARAVQIDIEASMLSLRYPADVNLHGDAAATLKALLPLIRRKDDREWSRTIESHMAAWWEKLEGRAKADANPVNPQRVVWEMSPLLPANAIVTSDSGSCANWYARDYRVQQGQSSSLSGGLASMGVAVPYSIGAKFAHPDRPVVALVGDGAMQMNNMAELITVQKYWKRWIDPRWIVCVFNNQDLNEVTWEQRVMEGNPKFEASQDIPDFAYAKFGEMLGFRGIFVDSPDRLASAWQEALSSDRPVVLEVKTDPEVAPLPPHVTLKEARSFMSAMAKGDRGAGRVIGDTARQVVDGLFGKKD